MAFKVGSSLNSDKVSSTSTGVPYLWGTGDTTTLPSNEVKITASDGTSYDNFGWSVAVGFNKIVVGAKDRDGSAGGSSSAKGGVYTYDLDGSNEDLIYSTSNQEEAGYSVAIGSGTIAFGQPRKNAFWGGSKMYELNGNELTNNYFDGLSTLSSYGHSMAFGEGMLVVGAPNLTYYGTQNGGVYLLDAYTGEQLTDRGDNGRFGGSWLNSGSTNSQDFGHSVAVGCGRIVVGDPIHNFDRGRVGVYDTNGNELFYLDGQYLNNYFGFSVAIAQGRIVVGAPEYTSDADSVSYNRGAMYIYDLNGNLIKRVINPFPGTFDNFGRAVAVGEGRIVIGAYYDDDEESSRINHGAVHVFDLEGNFLTQLVGSDTTTNDFYGQSVAIGCGKIVVGAYEHNTDQGAVYVYDTPSVYTLYDAIELNRGYK